MKTHTDISGWFDYANIYDFLLSTIPDNGIFVECGAWLGKSSSYLCDHAHKRNISVFIIDSWLGSDNEIDTFHRLAKQQDIYQIFLDNMGGRRFTPIRKLSTEAVSDFKNNSCDVIFIDMNHSYESVKEDISIWLPKVKHGGYLAGHDYNHAGWPGVVRAVDEILGPVSSNQNLTINNNCWIYHNKPISEDIL